MIEFLPQVPPIYQTQLAFELDPTDMVATIATELLISGLPLSGLVCFSVDIGQPNPEYMIGTLSGNTFTITLRNVDPLDPTVSLGTFSSVHRQGAVVKITDFATIGMMRNILQGDQPIQNPLRSSADATEPDQVPNLSQLNAVVINGAVPANLDVMGITELSVSPDTVLGNPTITIASPAVVTLTNHGLHANDIVKFTTSGALPTGITSGQSYFVLSTGLTSNTFEISATAGGAAINTTGSQSGTHTLTRLTPVALGQNDYRLSLNSYGASSGGTDTYATTLNNPPAAYIIGQQFSFKADVGNTGPATLNINGIGAKTIKKNVSTDLQDGDILAGQIVVVEYDGTNMQMISNLPSGVPIVHVYGATNVGDGSTVYTITNPSGTTFRYTYNSGTNPNITALSFPIGGKVIISANTGGTGMVLGNRGKFTITGSGANYFEVTNASGVAEASKSIGAGGFLQVTIPATWTKPSGLRYIIVEAIGAGGGGASGASRAIGGAGGGGGYTRKLIPVASLGATETATPGAGGVWGTAGAGGNGDTSSFGSQCSATGGNGGSASGSNPYGGAGGMGVSGDINVQGGAGSGGLNDNGSDTTVVYEGTGGSSVLGGGGGSNTGTGSQLFSAIAGGLYGGGGGSGISSGLGNEGGSGGGGVIIVTEYYI